MQFSVKSTQRLPRSVSWMFLPQKKTYPCNFCKRMQRIRTQTAGKCAPSPVSHIFLPLKNFPPGKKTIPVKFMLAVSAAVNRCPLCFFPREKTSSPVKISPSRFTVVTLCALLTHYLLAIAKFLGKFGNPFHLANE